MPFDPTCRTLGKGRRAADYAGVVDVQLAPLNLLAPPSSKLLIRLAARKWGVTEEKLFSESRDALVVAARHHAMWLLRTHRCCSLPQIGRLLGNRDHTSVINGIAKHIARSEGRIPVPFVWTRARAENVSRFARTGAVLEDIKRHFAMTNADLYRHPAFPHLKALAEVEHSYRQMAIARRRKAVAHA